MIVTQAKATTRARALFRRVLADRGAARVEQLVQAGLSRELVPALDYLYRGTLSAQDARVVARVEGFRSELARRDRPIQALTPTGTMTLSPEFVAHHSSVSPEWGAFLYLAGKGFRADTILELGSAAGISGSYLASIPTCTTFTTIERSPELAALAQGFITQVKPDARIVNAPFEEARDRTLAEYGESLSLYYVDGNHYYEPTLEHLAKGIPHLKPGALVVFDDIHWSEEMWNAWRVIRQHSGFVYTLDMGRFGVCLWQGGNTVPKQYNLAIYAGWLFNYTPRWVRLTFPL